MIHLITYSNDLYRLSRDYCGKMAFKKGRFDSVTLYSPEDIDEDFYNNNMDILNIKTGNGLWLWKPYFLNKKLEEVQEGDIVFYSDAGSYFFRSCEDIINSMDEDIWISSIPLIEKQFTKYKLFENMNCLEKKYMDTPQIQANFIALKKTDKGLEFAKEWLRLCCDKNNILADEIEKNTFVNHRYDQSILSLITKKWNLKVHMDPSQYGRVPEKYYSPGRIFLKPTNNNEYKPSIILHRGKKPSIKTCFFQWSCTWLPLWLIHIFSKPCRQLRRLKCSRNEE